MMDWEDVLRRQQAARLPGQVPIDPDDVEFVVMTDAFREMFRRVHPDQISRRRICGLPYESYPTLAEAQERFFELQAKGHKLRLLCRREE